MGLKSKVSVAKTGTSSLRTTIPEGIVEYLNLKPGDTLEWSMEIVDNATRATLVKRVKK
jgi:bifunctional DNA-binding transcriptional regulator/antitoxin component of YhaV-PrlF toxin-antitoxin module